MAGRDFIEVTSLSAIAHILQHRPERIQRLIIQQVSVQLRSRVGELQALAKAAGVAVDTSPGGGRRGHGHGADKQEPVRALLLPFEYTELDVLLQSAEETPRSLIVALDHLQDPQNLGAICRSAEGFGAAAVVLPKDRSVHVGPGVYNASVGAVETVPIVLAGNLGESLRKMKSAGYWIIGASLTAEAKPPWDIPDFEKAVLVMGAELEGLSQSIEKLCDWHTMIPLEGRIESLNVSNATAVLLYELTRPGRKA